MLELALGDEGLQYHWQSINFKIFIALFNRVLVVIRGAQSPQVISWHEICYTLTMHPRVLNIFEQWSTSWLPEKKFAGSVRQDKARANPLRGSVR